MYSPFHPEGTLNPPPHLQSVPLKKARREGGPCSARAGSKSLERRRLCRRPELESETPGICTPRIARVFSATPTSPGAYFHHAKGLADVLHCFLFAYRHRLGSRGIKENTCVIRLNRPVKIGRAHVLN